MLGFDGFGQQVAVPVTNSPAARPVDALSHITRRKDGLQRLEEEITRSLQSFAPKGPLNDIAPPDARPPAIVNVRPKKDSGKGWTDLLSGDREESGSPDRTAKTPEFREDLFQPSKQTPQTPLEKLFDAMHSSSGSFSETESSSSAPARDAERPDQTQGDENLPPSLRGTQEALRKELTSPEWGDSVFGGESGRGGSGSIFNFRAQDNPVAPAQASPFVQQYRQLLGFEANVSPLGSLNASSASGSALAPAFTAPRVDSFRSSTPSFEREQNIQERLTGTYALPDPSRDLNDQALNRWNTYNSSPLRDNPRRAVVPSVTVEAPRRRF